MIVIYDAKINKHCKYDIYMSQTQLMYTFFKFHIQKVKKYFNTFFNIVNTF